MIEVGDMILYVHWNEDNLTDDDIGWVVHTEKHKRNDGLANLIYIKWLGEDSVDYVWQHAIDAYNEFVLVKGGQHG